MLALETLEAYGTLRFTRLGAAFYGVWTWAEKHQQTIMEARAAFNERKSASDAMN